MGDNMGDDSITNLDLNHEPLVDPSPSSPPAPSPRSEIENRIRHLEAVAARVRQPQRWRRIINNPPLTFMSVVNPINDDIMKNCKRDISHLAKALEVPMDLDAKKTDNDGYFYDCNICLDMAKDPILTCCGHLFCWGCFYQVPYVDSISKECPVCKGEVIDSNITPIYGNGTNSKTLELDSGVKIPPRPKAHRVESVRQQSFDRVIGHNIPVADALRRIRIGLGLIEEHPPSTSVNNPPNSGNSEAERFVEDLETYIIDGHMSSDPTSQPSNEERVASDANSVAIQSELQRNVSTTVLHLGNLATDGSVEVDLTISRPVSSRRRRLR